MVGWPRFYFFWIQRSRKPPLTYENYKFWKKIFEKKIDEMWKNGQNRFESSVALGSVFWPVGLDVNSRRGHSTPLVRVATCFKKGVPRKKIFWKFFRKKFFFLIFFNSLNIFFWLVKIEVRHLAWKKLAKRFRLFPAVNCKQLFLHQAIV